MNLPLTIPDIATVGIFCFIIWSTWIQFNYYRKTTRPFVFVSDTEFLKSQKPGNDFSVSIKINNAGSLPAKEVIADTILLEEISKKSNFLNFNYPQDESGDIFPNQPVDADRIAHDREFFREKPYLHIIVKYKDISGKVYYYKTIRHIDVEAPYDIKLIWSDFD